MGLVELLLGKANPVSQFVAQNRNAIRGAGAGFGSATNIGDGFGAAARGAAAGAPVDDAFATSEKERMTREQMLQTAISNIRDKYQRPDIADMMETGGLDIQSGWNAVLDGMKPADPVKPTSSMQEYDFARSQGYDGTFQQYETDMKKAGATSIDFNQNQGVAAGFADRMAASDAILADPKLTSAQTDVMQQGLGGVPGVGNFLTSEDKKLADQAQRDFINALLRRESGAAIAPSEFDNAAKQYFPQPGDTPAVIKQKADNRKIALQGVARAAGPAYQSPPTMAPGGVVDFTTYFGGGQ